MNKFALPLAAALVLLGQIPVFADDSTSDLDDFIVQTSVMPMRLLGVVTGITIGVPVATVKATINKTAAFQTKISKAFGDDDSVASAIYSTAVAVPGGILGGAIDGTYTGCKHGLTSGFERPFSAQSMSLADND